MKVAYFGLPLGALLLRRDGHQLSPIVLSPVEAPGRFRLRRLEPDLIDGVLDDLRRVTARVGVFTVEIVPARESLPDGRNAHLIQRPPSWWLPKLMERFELVAFNRVPRGFWVGVERKAA